MVHARHCRCRRLGWRTLLHLHARHVGVIHAASTTGLGTNSSVELLPVRRIRHAKPFNAGGHCGHAYPRHRYERVRRRDKVIWRRLSDACSKRERARNRTKDFAHRHLISSKRRMPSHRASSCRRMSTGDQGEVVLCAPFGLRPFGPAECNSKKRLTHAWAVVPTGCLPVNELALPPCAHKSLFAQCGARTTTEHCRPRPHNRGPASST